MSKEDVHLNALSWIDRDYDNPVINETINKMIVNEMRKFNPIDYVAHIPLPEQLFLKSNLLQNEYGRVVGGLPAATMDLSRYEVLPPVGNTEKDVNAWKECIANAKSQLMHTQNHLLNLQIAEENLNKTWLKTNKNLEKTIEVMSKRSETLQTFIREINKTNKMAQDEVAIKLNELISKRDQAILSKLTNDSYYVTYDQNLKSMGFDYEQQLKDWEKEQKDKENMDWNAPELNSTVKEYETVFTREQEENSGEKEEKDGNEEKIIVNDETEIVNNETEIVNDKTEIFNDKTEIVNDKTEIVNDQVEIKKTPAGKKRKNDSDSKNNSEEKVVTKKETTRGRKKTKK